MIGLLTALWRRPELSALVQRYYLRFDMLRVAVRSPGDPQKEIEGWSYVDAPNEPLGQKWNAGLRAFSGSDVDAVMITGSDDFIAEDYIREATDLMSHRDVVQCRGLWVWDGSLVRLYPAAPGAGRMIRREVLEKMDWTLWGDENRYLDAQATRALQKRWVKESRLEGVVLDVKTEENIWKREGRALKSGEKTIQYGSAEEKSIDDLPPEIQHYVRRLAQS